VRELEPLFGKQWSVRIISTSIVPLATHGSSDPTYIHYPCWVGDSEF